MSAEHSHRRNIEHQGFHVEQIVCFSGPTGKRPYSLNQARLDNIYETKRDGLKVIPMDRLACSSILRSGFFSERVDNVFENVVNIGKTVQYLLNNTKTTRTVSEINHNIRTFGLANKAINLS